MFNKLKTITTKKLSLKPLYLLASVALGCSSGLFVEVSQAQTAENSHTSVAYSTNQRLADGVYLYGQSAQPDQVQQEYFVFEVRGKRVLGAFFMPRSSFDCFYGTLDAGSLDLTIIDSYEQVSFAHTVALAEYQKVGEISDRDQRLLTACTASNEVRQAVNNSSVVVD